MARPVAAPALPTSTIDVARAAGVAVVVLVLTVFIVWPIATLAVRGLLSPMTAWPWRVALRALAVALSSALVALVLAALVTVVVTRVDVPGRAPLWRVFGLGALIPPFIVPLALLVLAGLLAPGRAVLGFTAIVVGQSLAFLPYAVALLARALERVPVELEQAAEVLGASRTTIARRVTLGLAGPDLLRAALIVLGLCLADVATPLLLGGDVLVLTTMIVTAAMVDRHGAVAAALLLGALGIATALIAGAWRSADAAAGDRPVLPRLERPAPVALRWALGSMVWIVAAVLAALWAVVPLGSLLRVGVGPAGLTLQHWSVFSTPSSGAGAVANSALLGLGVAVAGTALALATAWIVERGAGYSGGVVEVLARMPIVVPGVVAGVGYLLVFGRPTAMLAGTFSILIAILACWELPVTSRAARDVLLRTDRSVEDAAVGLGAGRATALARIAAPALRPVAGWLFGYLFAIGVLAVGTVIVLADSGRELGALTMLTLAAAGATGAACAVATALLALAGGAVLLGRAIAGRQRGPTLLA